MSVIIALRQKFTPESILGGMVRSYASAAVAFGLSLILFFGVKYHLIASMPYATYNIDPHPATFLLRVCLVFALALAGMGIRMAALDVPVQRFLRVIIPVVAFYVFLVSPHVIPVDFEHETQVRVLMALSWLAPLLAVLAWWRPSFFLPVVALMLWQKMWLPVMNDGYSVTPTDYMPLFDAALLMLVAIGTLRLLGCFRPWHKLEQLRINSNTITPLMFIFMGLIAIHFSNYFHSGTAKIFLDGGPLRWVLENRTDMLAHVTWELGFLPIAAWPALAGLVLTAMAPPVVQIINILTLVPQLLCPLVVFSRRLLIFTLLFFDLQHIIIYLVSGIAFWKWVALNTAFVIALVQWEKARTPAPLALVMVFLSTVVLMVPGIKLPGGITLADRGQAFFFTARLGWYDSPAANDIYLTAILDDGREMRVPSNYFLGFSAYIAQQRMSAFAGNLWPTGTWGSTAKYEVMKGGLVCDLPLTVSPTNYEKRDKFIAFIKMRHARTLLQTGKDGQLAYDLYPHHIWSNPALYREFAEIDLRQIRMFRLNFDAVCADWSGGERRTRLVTHQNIDIPLD